MRCSGGRQSGDTKRASYSVFVRAVAMTIRWDGEDGNRLVFAIFREMWGCKAVSLWLNMRERRMIGVTGRPWGRLGMAM